MRNLILLLLVLLSFFNSSAQNQVPDNINNNVVLLDELDAQFYKAAQNFINFRDQNAAEDISKAAFFITMQAYDLNPEYREKFRDLQKKLNNLSADLKQGKINTIQQLTRNYAECYLVLANFYLEHSLVNYNDKNDINCVILLYSAANNLILGAKWVGYEVGAGTRGTRKSIASLSNAVNSRSEINQVELKKVLDFIQKEIKKFDQRMSQK